ncbi:hypothetical protein [Conservatibacter flavescens]|uniref:DUF945 domain-containing protein n=1 Tax=Conservatibacter flavescens TaxID=28161 RepID=A0A2M8S0H6_9PAST|nr:hypothetical protein [Conservatibacter flavescens]PJG84649.1 hypothetical protein CVP05_10265 [Conservatibacter flavescens]
MNKKTKITLNLSIIATLLAVSAQFYTNYKINQTLQQFPYYFSDKFIIHVTQPKNTFFSRELVFSLENLQDKDHAKTEIISTKLTALPFAIIANSELPAPLIKQLNEKLNITIDENSIHSKFSVVGNYLQSTMQTKFRDFTNINQVLETNLNFAAKTKFVEIKTALSAFNYNSVTKIGKLTGTYTLEPMGEHRYDLIQANISIDKLNLTDGENNKFDFDKLNYQFDKSFNEQTYNLNLALNYDKFTFSGKQKNFEIQNSTITANQVEIPNYLNFYEKFKQFNEESSLKDLVLTGLDYLFENKQSEWKINAKEWRINDKEMHLSTLKNPSLRLNINNEKKQQAQITSKFTLDSFVTGEHSDKKVQIQDITVENQISELNLSAHLSMLKKYLFDQNNQVPFDTENFFKKDNPAFIEDLTALIQEYHAQNQSKIAVKSIAIDDEFSLKNLNFDYSDKVSSNDQLELKLHFLIDSLELKNENVQFTQLTSTIPINLGPLSTIYPIYYCTNNLFALTCANNIGQNTYDSFISKAITDFHLDIPDAHFSTEMDTLPASQKHPPITASLTASVKAIPNKKRADFLAIGDKLEKTDLSAQLNIPASLIQDMFTDSESESTKLKMQSNAWLSLYHLIKTDNNAINPIFELKDDAYVSEYIQKEGNIQINQKSLEAIRESEVQKGN